MAEGEVCRSNDDLLRFIEYVEAMNAVSILWQSISPQALGGGTFSRTG